MKINTAVLILTLLSFNAIGGGFQINTQGAKALGMGGCFTGLANDASSVYFNPAGMSDLKFRHEIYAGVSIIIPQVAVQTAAVNSINQNSPIATPIELYYVFKCTDKLSFGLGINNQFGAKSSYPDDWEGKYIIQELSLKSYLFQPTASYKINDYLNIGAGFVYGIGTFELKQAVPLETNSTPYGEAQLTGKGNAMGYNLGLLSHLKDYGSIGISYRSKFQLKLNNGDATFTNIPDGVRNLFPPTTTFASSVTLPAVLCIGISKEFMDKKLTVTIDFWRTFWHTYDTLKFTFSDTATPSIISPRLYQDVNFFGLGAAYKINKKITARAGAFYDFSPIKDGYVSPELPDGDTFGWSVGSSFKFNETFAFDLSFLNYNITMTRSFTEKGFTAKYHKIISVIDVGINVSFGKKFLKKDAE